MSTELKEGEIPLPNGCTLYWRTDQVGCRHYFSDEIGGGVDVWFTALVCDSTILAALANEARLKYLEAMTRQRAEREQTHVDRSKNDHPETD